MLNRNSLPVQFRAGVKKYPLFFVWVFFFPSVLFFPIHNCLMMRSLSRDVHSAYLNRLPGFHSHSSAKKRQQTHFCQAILTSVHQLDSAPWMDEAMNVGLLAQAIQMMPVSVCFPVMLILFCSLPFPKPFTVGGALRCSSYVGASVLL